MRHFKHPATIIALIALFAALSGGAGAAVSGLISGSQIKNGSIPITKLSASAIKTLQVTGAARTRGSGGSGCSTNTSSSPTFCGNPATVMLKPKTVVLVNGAVDMASNDGLEISGDLAVCYAPHGSGTLTEVDHMYPDFVAPQSSYFAQGVTGVVGGLTGSYDVGMCVANESANTALGNFTVTILTAVTTKGVKNLS